MTCIHELFATQAERTPDAVAVVFGDSSLTYRELNRRADAIAQRLCALGVGPDVLVALYLQRSLDMVVGMLGVLKAGGAYVPLDPGHPPMRLAYMLGDARPLVLLTQARLMPDLPQHNAKVLAIDTEAPAHDPLPPTERTGSPTDLAYVIYTSGSTGEPKGVEIEHGSVVNMLASMQRRPGLTAEDVMLAITTLTFDIAVLEIFLPLVCGARVVIAGGDVVNDGPALAELIARSGVTVLQATPATLRMLLDAGWQGHPHLKILCGGEAWTAEFANELLPRCASLWNMYGPTETTVWSAVARVEPGRPVAIGRPIANTRLYVLDGMLQLVPVGVSGELFIGGAGSARGYHDRPELTRERFVLDPYAGQPGARMYRTGDLVRRQPDGTLDFLGRLDHQVKIRGHRIELGEIEAALARQPGIEHCVVAAREDTPGEQRLVAYVIPAPGCAVAPIEIRGALSETLPGYMIPAAFVSLDALPLTPNGKLDRKALPPPEKSDGGPTTVQIEPRTSTERVVAHIWCDMLGREQVGLRDNFFDLGGHSLLALRVIGEINKTLKVRLHVPAFFQNPTIEGVVGTLAQTQHRRPEPRVVPVQTGRSGLPVYFMGARHDEYRIARLIGGDRTIYAIDVPMPEEWHQALARSDRAALPTIEQLSALYGIVLCAHAGSSPCVVAGYSLGGKIAFEAVHALRRAGGNVACVLLVDAWAFSYSGATRGPGWQSLQWIWRNAAPRASDGSSYLGKLSSSFEAAWRLLRWLLARTPQAVKNRTRPAPIFSRPSGFFDDEGTPIDQALINQLVRVMGRAWHPRPVDVPSVLFRARAPGMELLPGYDSTNGWSNLFTQGLEIVQSAGDHVSMVSDENIGVLARQITAMLDRFDVAQNANAAKLGDGTVGDLTAQKQWGADGFSETGHIALHASNG